MNPTLNSNMPSLLTKLLHFIPPPPLPKMPLSVPTSVFIPRPSSSISTKPRLRGVVFDMDGTLTVPVIDFAAMYREVLGETEYVEIKKNNPSGIDILHHIENWSDDKQRRAYEVIADFEKQGMDKLQIMPVPVIDFTAMYREVLGETEYIEIKKNNPSGIDILHHIENWSNDKQRRTYKVIADFEKEGMDKLQIMPGALDLYAYLESRNVRRGLITRNVKAAVDLFHLRFGITFCPALSREHRPYKPDPAPLLHICSDWQVQPNEVMMIGDSLKDDVACGKRAGAFTCLLDETGRYDSPEYSTVEHKPDYKVTSLAEVHKLLETNFDLTP